MKMDNAGESPEGGSLDEAESSESWYFDLPSGAWERQEQKNRELRQRVLENATDRAERDPFARRKPEPEAKKGGLFGFGRKKDEPAPRESAGGTYRLARGGELPEPPAASAFDDDDDWSTESFSLPPAAPAEPPLRPHADEWAPPPAEDVEDPDAPSSRWEGVFGHESGGDEGGRSAMSAWTRRTPADEPVARDESHDEPEAIEPAALQEIQEPADDVADEDDLVVPFSKLNHENETEPDTSRWGGIFGHDAESEEDNGLAAMSAWAHRRSDDDVPSSPADHSSTDEAEAPADSDDGPKSWAEIRALRQKQHEEETLRSSGTATSRWESMFNVKPGEAGQARPAEGDEAGDDESQAIQSEGLAAMRAWLEKGPVIDEDDHPRRILAGDDDEVDEEIEEQAPRPIRADLLEPFDWERDDSPSAPAEVPPELLKPFDWESDEPVTATDEDVRHGLHLVTEDDDATAALAESPHLDDDQQPWEVEDPATEGELPAESEPVAWAADPEPPMAMESESEDSDLSLFGDFDAQPTNAGTAPEPRQPKRGLLGRLFGRRSSEPAETVAGTDQAKSDWFAVDDAFEDDLRTATPAAAAIDSEPAVETVAELADGAWASDEAVADEAEPATAWRWPAAQIDADEADATTAEAVTDEVEPASAWRWPDRQSDPDEAETVAVAGEEPWQPFGTSEPVSERPEAVATAEFAEDEDSGWQTFEAPADDTVVEPAASAIPTSSETDDEAGGWAPEPFQFAATPPASDLAFESVVAEPEDAAPATEPVAVESPLADLEEDASWVAEFDADEAEVDEQTFESPVMESPAAIGADETEEDAESTWSWDFDDLDDEPVVTNEPVASVSEDEFAWVPTDAGDGDAPAEAWIAGSEQPAELPLPAAFHEVALDPEMDEDPWQVVAEVDEGVPASEPQTLVSVADDEASDEPWAAVDALDAASDDADDEDWRLPEETTETLAPAAELDDNEPELAASSPPPVSPFRQDDPWAEFISRREREVSQEERVAAEQWNDVFGTAPQGKSDAEAGDGDQASAEAATADLHEAEPFDTGSYSDAREPVSPPAAGSDSDDPWAAIAAASGYDAATDSGMAVYTPNEPEPPAEDPWESFTASHQRYASETPPAREVSRPPAPVTPPAARWDDDEANLSPDEFIVRAFERKAAEQLPEEREASFGSMADIDEGVTSLLGDEGEDIMRETAESEAGPRSFARMSAWAPQRVGRRVDNPNEAPWESDYPDDDEFRGLGGPSYEPPLNADVPPPPYPPSEAFDGFDPQPVPMGTRRSKTKTWVREVVETGLLALLVFLSVRASFQNFKVDGSSMYPTLQNGQFLIVNKLEYSQVDMDKLSNFVPFVDPGANPKRNVFHPPQRGDIVVLQDPRKPDTDLIKRIIALPGETVEIVNGRVYIDDHLLEEPYIKSPWHDTKAKITIPEGQYYVLGDNRDNSLDSRSSQVGLVPEDLIIGKATLSYWPLDRFGLAPNDGGDISLKDGPPRLSTQAVPAP